MRGAFITGCATGFGRGLAERLLADGWRVVASDPNPDALIDLDGAEITALDVTKPEEIADAAEFFLAGGRIDVVVNNGGYAVFGTQEEADLDAVAAMFDVNVLGVARVTRAFLPHLRAVGGTVVNISSVAGRMAFTESGFYAATKHAVEAMSEALYAEVAAFGMRVVLVEPGSFDTQFLTTARRMSRPRDAASPYSALFETWDRRKFEVLEDPQDPGLVVHAIAAALERGPAFQRIAVGVDAERMLDLLDALTPDAWARLVAWRAGGPFPNGLTDILPPRATLDALAAGRSSIRLSATRAAFRAGFLTPWKDDAVGRAALRALAV